jgi:hypothetical protein
LEKLGGRKKISSAREKEKKWREKISFILKFLELLEKSNFEASKIDKFFATSNTIEPRSRVTRLGEFFPND